MKGRIALLIGAVLFSLVVLELGVRLVRGPEWLVQWPNLVLAHQAGTATDRNRHSVHDDALGFVPRPGARLRIFSDDSQGVRIVNASHDEQGMRVASSAEMPILTGPMIVAAGDSFTYGAEVDDADTWPLALQTILGQRVVNAGVNGYGIDQTVLRAEQAWQAMRPPTVVVSVIHDDLRRAEMSRVWGANKPYFDVSDGRLQLRNVPVPRPSLMETPLTIWQRAFGQFVLVQMAMEALGLMDEWSIDIVRVHPEGEGERIGCLLMGRLASLGRETGTRVVIVALYDADAWRWRWLGLLARQRKAMTGLLSCAENAGLDTVDTYQAFAQAIAAKDIGAFYHRWHPNKEGNRLIAELIAARLRQPQ
jgi:hypothetical protein